PRRGGAGRARARPFGLRGRRRTGGGGMRGAEAVRSDSESRGDAMRTGRAIAALCCAAAALVGAAPARADAQCPWMDAHKSSEERASELVRAMSLDDKIHMLHGSEYVMWAYGGSAGHVAGISSLCIPDLV